jgi:hypothetical protein
MKKVKTHIGILLFLVAGTTFTAFARQNVDDIVNDKALLDAIIQRIVQDDQLNRELIDKLIGHANENPVFASRLLQAVKNNDRLSTEMLAMLKQNQDKTGQKEIIVKFKPGATLDQIKTLEQEIGLAEIKDIRALRMKVYRIISDKKPQDAIRACQGKNCVEYAEENQEYRTQN